MIFADVIVDISVKSLDRPFSYIVPEEWIEDAVIGAQVTIPFGKGNRQMKGYIIGLSEKPKYDIERTKCILAVEKQGVVVESHLLSLAYWMKENYGATINDAIKAVLPVKRELREKVKRQVFPSVSRQDLTDLKVEYEKKHNVARVRLLDALLSDENAWEEGMDYEEVTKKWKVTSAVLKTMQDKQIIKITSTRLYRNPVKNQEIQKEKPVLNHEQKAVVEGFLEDYLAGKQREYLIHGVTGSGKTEVYMALIEAVLQVGKQAIVLIPEIALTFQTVNRFYGRFGDKVSIMHSRLSAGERFDQFERAKNGEIQIMIGPRSALFTPFQNLGLIVMDEEHESSYQSDSPPKYHAREVAVRRGRMLGASVVFGSATPSLEVYRRCELGEYKLFRLQQRAGDAKMPAVSIVDLREEFAAKNYSVFSRSLQEKIETRLRKRQQTMLFINRRGYAGFVSCRKCGEVIQCENCSVSMKPHEYRGEVSILKCHYCGAQKAMPKECPSCHSRYIGTFGLGTQQVEEMVKKRFPDARVLRMDADTTTGKEGHEKILKDFSKGNADILIGTQMIVKGHDFPNVTLVGVLAADLSLNTGDFRSAERTFELLAQAAGRAGRGKEAGEVVFQTYQPEHYSIQCAAREDYDSFYRQELIMRRMLQYPPISNILEVLVSSEIEETTEMFAENIKDIIGLSRELLILGPADAPIKKMKNIYRKVLYLKDADYEKLKKVKDEIEQYHKIQELDKGLVVTFTFHHS